MALIFFNLAVVFLLVNVIGLCTVNSLVSARWRSRKFCEWSWMLEEWGLFGLFSFLYSLEWKLSLLCCMNGSVVAFAANCAKYIFYFSSWFKRHHIIVLYEWLSYRSDKCLSPCVTAQLSFSISFLSPPRCLRCIPRILKIMLIQFTHGVSVVGLFWKASYSASWCEQLWSSGVLGKEVSMSFL